MLQIWWIVRLNLLFQICCTCRQVRNRTICIILPHLHVASGSVVRFLLLVTELRFVARFEGMVTNHGTFPREHLYYFTYVLILTKTRYCRSSISFSFLSFSLRFRIGNSTYRIRDEKYILAYTLKSAALQDKLINC